MTVKLDPVKKAQWVAALRSGQFPQGKSSLNDQGNYCCLGVVSELAARVGVCERIDTGTVVRYDEDTMFLPPAVRQWLDATREDGTKYGGDDFLVVHQGASRYLSHLNDIGIPFDEIANLIEEQL